MIPFNDLKHGIRVAKVSLSIAKEMGVSEDFIQNLYLAGLFHDIGKVSIPDHILNKPGKLTEFEFDTIKNHPVLSSRELFKLDYDTPVLEMVKHHHEKFDGSGYPSGLAKDNIPLGSRILAIADVYDALCMERPYRAALSKGVAIEIMLSEKKSFDPEILEYFLYLIKNGTIK